MGFETSTSSWLLSTKIGLFFSFIIRLLSEAEFFNLRSLSTNIFFFRAINFLSKLIKKLQSGQLLTRCDNLHFCTFHEQLVVPSQVPEQRFHATE